MEWLGKVFIIYTVSWIHFNSSYSFSESNGLCLSIKLIFYGLFLKCVIKFQREPDKHIYILHKQNALLVEAVKKNTNLSPQPTPSVWSRTQEVANSLKKVMDR